MSTGVWIVLAVLVLATAFGLWRRRTDGSFTPTEPAPVIDTTPVEPAPETEPEPDPQVDAEAGDSPAPLIEQSVVEPAEDSTPSVVEVRAKRASKPPAAEAPPAEANPAAEGTPTRTPDPEDYLVETAWAGESTAIAEEDGPEPEHLAEGASIRAALGEHVPADAYGERATLLQFSSAFCAPCRVARRVLAEVAEAVPGVSHVEVDAEAHLDAVRLLDVHRTPTTLILDASGRETARAVGAPRKEQVLAALAPVVQRA